MAGYLKIPSRGVRWAELEAPGPVFVSYFTDLFYLREAFELVRSLQACDLAHDVRQEPDEGSWQGNTRRKPEFLLRMAAEHPTRSLVWLDADARVRRRPELLFELEVPVAYHRLLGHEALSGTVLLAAHPQREEFLREWIAQCQERPRDLDQQSMEAAARKLGLGGVELPVEYCWIFDHNEGRRGFLPDPASRPVVEHLQASRFRRRLSP